MDGTFKVEMHVPEAGGTSAPYQVINVNLPPIGQSFDPGDGSPPVVATPLPLPDLMKNGRPDAAKFITPGTVEKGPDNAADWWGFDLRIRQEGWEVELLIRAEAARLAEKLV